MHKILKKYWGFDNFRPLQEEVINSILEQKDTLALLPTGGGKSICFQVPALALDGICIVVSPLIALMHDQVLGLKKRGIKAIALSSGMRKSSIDIALDNCIYGNIKFLYVSPERLSSKIFIERFKKMNVSFIAVDEAHCISQWGYDFRPAYLKIAEIRELKPSLSILALTATATPEVAIDIQKKLLFQKINLLQKSFLRNNLSYTVLYENTKYIKLLDILHKVSGTAIVYVQNRRGTREISDLLNNNNIHSTFYHAGLSHDERDKRQSLWIEDKIRVIVATNAFGMGIDKPNVKVVIHISLPDSLEAYFQEAGRAGRDGKKAYAVLLYNDSDKIKKENIIKDTMPSIEEIRLVYESLGNYFQLAIGSGKEKSFLFDISKFCERIHLNVIKVYNALKFIESNEYLILSDSVNQSSKVYIKCTKKVLDIFLSKQIKYVKFFKLMLRSYGGMFDGFINIKEQYLANKLNVPLTTIIKDLKYLEAQNIIYYEAQNSNPLIFFLVERLEIKDLKLDVININKRIKIFEQKHQQMLLYAMKKNNCRSNMLLQYFGENNDIPCGICDVCLGRNIEKIDSSDIELLATKIKQIIKNKPSSLSQISKKLNINNSEKLYQTIRYLMENNFIIKKLDGTLYWEN